MILKILLVALVIAVVYFMIKKKPSLKEKNDAKNSSEMVECAECGVYCDLGEALISGGKYYCSKECMDGKR